MASTLSNLLISNDTDSYYTVGFKRIIEDHVQYLQKHEETVSVPITPMQCYKYQFDVIGLFKELNISSQIYWATARVNGFLSFTDLPEDTTEILVPSSNEISRLKQVYESGLSKLN